MEALKLTARVDEKGHLRLDIPTQLPEGEVELVIVVKEVFNKPYDFDDLVGTIAWQSDAVETQRRLRDER